MRDLVALDKAVAEMVTVGGPGIELDVFPWLRYFPNKSFENITKIKKAVQNGFQAGKQHHHYFFYKLYFFKCMFHKL